LVGGANIEATDKVRIRELLLVGGQKWLNSTYSYIRSVHFLYVEYVVEIMPGRVQ
jgi:hypothetical protein